MSKIFYVSIFLISVSLLIAAVKNKKYPIDTIQQNINCLKIFEQDVKQYWHYDSQGKYYVAEYKFLDKLFHSHYPCMKGVDTSYLYKILGKESTIIGDDSRNNKFIQYQSQRGIKNEWSLTIGFDKKGKLTNVNSGLVAAALIPDSY